MNLCAMFHLSDRPIRYRFFFFAAPHLTICLPGLLDRRTSWISLLRCPREFKDPISGRLLNLQTFISDRFEVQTRMGGWMFLLIMQGYNRYCNYLLKPPWLDKALESACTTNLQRKIERDREGASFWPDLTTTLTTITVL